MLYFQEAVLIGKSHERLQFQLLAVERLIQTPTVDWNALAGISKLPSRREELGERVDLAHHAALASSTM